MGEYPLGFKVAGILVVGLVYGFRSWPWVSDRVSSYGFLVGVGRGFDCGGIWFEIWEVGMIVVVTSVGLVFGLRF